MGKIIAGIYELQEELGSGGGGVVYLGYHLRLNKKIVLKADKRSLNTEEIKLRREVDMLKGLSHTYIPQVYDYVQEDGIAYTIMDYIEGESLDKLLKEGKRVPQQEVIKWSFQLLKALDYLHTCPPYGILHGDIKPANIMRTPNGDIRLIDFNIALALGEEGAVKVGLSRGYASPEHYGITYISEQRAAAFHNRKKRKKIDKDSTVVDIEHTLVLGETDGEKTVLLEDSKATELTEAQKNYTRGGYFSIEHSLSGEDAISLDARSDVYSLGATLYHLISGRKPSPDAIDVSQLEKEVCSPALAVIIKKAMDPDIELRYQTAKEMLLAFQMLYKTDKRSILHKKRIVISSVLIVSLFAFGSSLSFLGLKQMQQKQEALALAEYSQNALTEGDVLKAVELALNAIPKEKNLLNAPITAEAQKALSTALGVYDLKDGFQEKNIISLPAIPFFICASTEGSYIAVSYAYELIILDTKEWNKVTTLKMEESSLAEAVFLNDHQIIYASREGISLYDILRNEVLWKGNKATALALSGDRKTVAALNRNDSKAAIYNTEDGSIILEKDFSGRYQRVPENDIFISKKQNIFSLNNKGNLLAVSFYNGELLVFNLEDESKDLVLQNDERITLFSGGFYQEYFLYTIQDSSGTEFYMVDMVKEQEIKGLESQHNIILQIGEEGVYLSNGNLLVQLSLDSFEEREVAYVGNSNIINYAVEKEYTLVTTDDNGFVLLDKGGNILYESMGEYPFEHILTAEQYMLIGNNNENTLRVMEKQNNDDKTIIRYDSYYDHDEARVALDGQSAILFNYREFTIFDKEGRVMAKQELPQEEKIYDQQYRRTDEGEWLEVIYYDGTVRHYNVKDGTLQYETIGEKPKKDLKEEFFIGEYKIISSLHEPPKVYDMDTGKYKMTLEEDAYLTYVTKVGDYIITEYITVEGERFGILHNSKFEILSFLPGLCDVIEETLYFDYYNGEIRAVKIQTVEELKQLGKQKIKEES